MRRATVFVAVLLVASVAAGIARADGHPASDVLPTEDVYLPVAQPSADAVPLRRPAPDRAAASVLAGLSVNRSSSDGLVRSAVAAVDKLRAAGALQSSDIKAPTTYPGLVTVHHGKVAKVTLRLFDDSERFGGTPTISVSWRAPRSLPKRLRLCVVATDPTGNRSAATDPTGNRSAANCVPMTVRAR